MAPCEFQSSPTNPLRGSCVSGRSRCGAVRISKLADEPSAGIVRVGALSLWRRENFLRRRCVSERSRCGAVRIFYVADEPSAEIMRVGSLSLWRRANLHAGRRTLCGDRACRIALAVAPCKFQISPTNPLRRLCTSDRPRCGAVRICTLADAPSAETARVESLSLWRRANCRAKVACEARPRISGLRIANFTEEK